MSDKAKHHIIKAPMRTGMSVLQSMSGKGFEESNVIVDVGRTVIQHVDEAHRIPHYKRLHAAYCCGCSFYSDAWLKEKDIPQECHFHNSKLKASTGLAQAGQRSDDKSIYESTFKASIELSVDDLK